MLQMFSAHCIAWSTGNGSFFIANMTIRQYSQRELVQAVVSSNDVITVVIETVTSTYMSFGKMCNTQSHLVQAVVEIEAIENSPPNHTPLAHTYRSSTKVSLQWWLTSPNHLACNHRHSITLVSIYEQQHTIVCAVNLDSECPNGTRSIRHSNRLRFHIAGPSRTHIALRQKFHCNGG